MFKFCLNKCKIYHLNDWQTYLFDTHQYIVWKPLIIWVNVRNQKKCINLNIHIRLEKLCYRLVAWQKHIRNSPQPLILNQPRYNLIRKAKIVKTLTLSLLQKVNSPNLLCFNINPPLSQHIFLKLTKHWYQYQNLFITLLYVSSWLIVDFRFLAFKNIVFKWQTLSKRYLE